MQNNAVTRSYDFELRAENNEQYGDYISGRPVVYDTRTDLGLFDEIIDRGALEKTNLRDVRLLVNHDFSMVPLARSRKNNKNSTMQFTVDNDGMTIRANLDTVNNSDARNLYSAIKRGDISGMSFAFSIDSEEWEGLETDHPLRRIKSIGQIFEVSAVTAPAYESTEISARNDREALDNARSALDNARNSLDNEAAALELEKAKNRNKFF